MKTTEKICYNCGKKMHTSEQYHWHDEFLGDFTIPCKREEYSYCDCGEERLAYSLCLRLEKAEQDRISQAIMNMAHNNLEKLEGLVVAGHDLEKIMHVSRQAICKNGKLKTLVYHIMFKGKKYYLYESVMCFLERGDGRFDLTQYIHTTTDDKSSSRQIGQTEITDNSAKRIVTTRIGTIQSQELSNLNLPINANSNWMQYNPQPKWQRYLNKGE